LLLNYLDIMSDCFIVYNCLRISKTDKAIFVVNPARQFT